MNLNQSWQQIFFPPGNYEKFVVTKKETRFDEPISPYLSDYDVKIEAYENGRSIWMVVSYEEYEAGFTKAIMAMEAMKCRCY